MKNKERLEDLLEEAFPVYNNKVISTNVNNGEDLNEKFVDKQENIFLRESIHHLKKQLIKKEEHYPEGDISDIQFTTEFFIIPRDKFLKITELINNIGENE